MECHQSDSGKFGRDGHGPRHGVGYVMEFQVEEDAKTLSGKYFHGLRTFGSEKLAPDFK
jgi:hypothetical protein